MEVSGGDEDRFALDHELSGLRSVVGRRARRKVTFRQGSGSKAFGGR